MGRRIMKTPQINQRDEDFMKMDSLHYLSEEAGLKIMSFWEPADGCFIEYLKPTIAREPKKEECRDLTDYDLRIASWIRTCTVRSPRYASFHEMVLGEIDRLKKLL